MAVKQMKVEEFEGLRPTAEYITRATTVRCLRCNRMLKNLLSVRRGYGPVCWGYVQATVARARMKPLTEVFKPELTEEQIDVLLQGLSTPPMSVSHYSEFKHVDFHEDEKPPNSVIKVLEEHGYKVEFMR